MEPEERLRRILALSTQFDGWKSEQWTYSARCWSLAWHLASNIPGVEYGIEYEEQRPRKIRIEYQGEIASLDTYYAGRYILDRLPLRRCRVRKPSPPSLSVKEMMQEFFFLHTDEKGEFIQSHYLIEYDDGCLAPLENPRRFSPEGGLVPGRKKLYRYKDQIFWGWDTLDLIFDEAI